MCQRRVVLGSFPRRFFPWTLFGLACCTLAAPEVAEREQQSSEISNHCKAGNPDWAPIALRASFDYRSLPALETAQGKGNDSATPSTFRVRAHFDADKGINRDDTSTEQPIVAAIDAGEDCFNVPMRVLSPDTPTPAEQKRGAVTRELVAHLLPRDSWQEDKLLYVRAQGQRSVGGCAANIETEAVAEANAIISGLLYAFRRVGESTKETLVVLAPSAAWAVAAPGTQRTPSTVSDRFTLLEAEIERGSAAAMQLSIDNVVADRWVGISSKHEANCGELGAGQIHLGVEVTWAVHEPEPTSILTIRHTGHIHPHVRKALPKASTR